LCSLLSDLGADLSLGLNLDGTDLGRAVQNLPELLPNLRKAYLSDIKINTFMIIIMEEPP